MAKREQLGAEGLKEQQPAQEEEKEVRSIARARAAYEQLMEEIRGYCQQARQLREQAEELQRSGRTDFQVREEIQHLLNRAEHLDAVVLPLKHNVQLLMGLPVRKLLDIMTVSQKRKRMLPFYVGLQQQAHGMHPLPNMIIVTEYELVEKTPGVFSSMCRVGPLTLLWRSA